MTSAADEDRVLPANPGWYLFVAEADVYQACPIIGWQAEEGGTPICVDPSTAEVLTHQNHAFVFHARYAPWLPPGWLADRKTGAPLADDE